MERADEHCYSAYIGDDYMPHINWGAYRERSAAVPKRLMYFLTLLIESLKNEANFDYEKLIDEIVDQVITISITAEEKIENESFDSLL